MSDPSPLLSKAGIEDAFRRLGERLARRGVVADLYVFGGAAMALAYDSRRATRDVDALFEPEHLLAMKAFAARPRDAQDIRQLVQVLDLHTVDGVLATVREIFPEEEPPARLRLLLEDIFGKE